MSNTDERHLHMLKTAFGESLLTYLENPQVLEIMLNPDGYVVVETLGEGKVKTDLMIPPAQSANIIKLLANYTDHMITPATPLVATELPFGHARFQGCMPPITKQPTFAIRKHLTRHVQLQDYVQAGALSEDFRDQLVQAVRERKNIIIAGGSSTGKTTFANALLSELNDSKDRILILEDLPELQLEAEDCVRLVSTTQVSMHALVKCALRLRPDRIIVGEVRDGTALDLLKAWNTGHPGGLCTLHANSVESVIPRLEDLIREVSSTVPSQLIHEAIDCIVMMKRQHDGRRVVDEIKFL